MITMIKTTKKLSLLVLLMVFDSATAFMPVSLHRAAPVTALHAVDPENVKVAVGLVMVSFGVLLAMNDAKETNKTPVVPTMELKRVVVNPPPVVKPPPPPPPPKAVVVSFEEKKQQQEEPSDSTSQKLTALVKDVANTKEKQQAAEKLADERRAARAAMEPVATQIDDEPVSIGTAAVDNGPTQTGRKRAFFKKLVKKSLQPWKKWRSL
jgi:type IV secretory pathway VirB10-like protein